MAVPFIIFICDLLAKLAAHTLVFFCAFKSAGAITAGAPKTFLYGLNDFLILVISYLHLLASTSFLRLSFGTYPIETSEKTPPFTKATMGIF